MSSKKMRLFSTGFLPVFKNETNQNNWRTLTGTLNYAVFFTSSQKRIHSY